MTLSEFISGEIASIVAEWEAFARTRLPAAHGLSSEALRDDAAVMLREFAADMASRQSVPEARAKSVGHSPDSSPALTTAAHAHATQRFAQGFTVNQMVSEYRALRAAVIERWTSQLGEVASSHLDELVRFGECVDQAVAESLSVHLGQLEKSRNLLLDVLGHDLRNPLGAISMSAEYLLRSDGLDAAQTKAVGRILNSADNMKRMFDDRLDFTETRLVRSMPLHSEASDLGDICSDVVNELRAGHPACDIHVARDGNLTGVWDQGRVKQMLSNLVANALQHGEATKAVSLLLEGDEREVVIAVHNEGKALSDEARRALFKPLVSQPSRRDERDAGSSGSALGLYIAHEIVVAHHGSIAVATSPADGTTFTVRLPRFSAPARR